MSTLTPEKDFGALYGEENRCPHCGALSRVERDQELRWICGVCGGPRVPAKVKLGEEGVQALRDAAAAKRSAAGARVASWGLGMTAAFALAFGIVIAWFGVAVTLGVVAAVAAATLSTKSRTDRKRAKSHVALAWENAIGSMLEASGKEATAKDIASALGVAEAEVETALTTLSVTGKTRVDVGNDAELHYRASEAPLPHEKEVEEEEAEDDEKRARKS